MSAWSAARDDLLVDQTLSVSSNKRRGTRGELVQKSECEGRARSGVCPRKESTDDSFLHIEGRHRAGLSINPMRCRCFFESQLSIWARKRSYLYKTTSHPHNTTTRALFVTNRSDVGELSPHLTSFIVIRQQSVLS
jgi:hypothetical protein